MACSAHIGPHEGSTGFLLTLLFLLYFSWSFQAEFPKVAPLRTWELKDQKGAVIKSLSTAGQPIFSLDLCDLFGKNWTGSTTTEGGCGSTSLESSLRDRDYYVCPREGVYPPPGDSCRGERYFLCGLWGDCKTLSSLKDDDRDLQFAKVDRSGVWTKQGTCNPGDCNPVEMRIKTWQKTDAWTRGKKWGIRLVFAGEDPGAIFTIQQKPWSHAPVGPLQPIHLGQNPQNAPSPPAVADVADASPNSTGTRRKGTSASSDVHPRVEPLVRSAELMYSLLNDSAPNITQDCWLCLHPEPSYYIGVAVEAQVGPDKGDIIKTSLSSGSLNSPECKWGTQLHQVTLRDVQGKGTCFVTEYYQLSASPIRDASPYQVHCSRTIRARRTQEWAALLKAPEGTWWVCASRMAPCVTLWEANQEELCVLTRILPRLYYAHGGTGWAHLRNQEEAHPKHKRAPVLVPLLAGAAIAGSIAVEATALAKEETIVKLDQQVDQDLRTLEDSMEALEGSLSSLAEVVLQNRRGLDLLFFKTGRIMCCP